MKPYSSAMWFLRPWFSDQARASSCSVSGEAENFADLFGSALGSSDCETDLLCEDIMIVWVSQREVLVWEACSWFI